MEISAKQDNWPWQRLNICLPTKVLLRGEALAVKMIAIVFVGKTSISALLRSRKLVDVFFLVNMRHLQLSQTSNVCGISFSVNQNSLPHTHNLPILWLSVKIRESSPTSRNYTQSFLTSNYLHNHTARSV